MWLAMAAVLTMRQPRLIAAAAMAWQAQRACGGAPRKAHDLLKVSPNWIRRVVRAAQRLLAYDWAFIPQ